MSNEVWKPIQEWPGYEVSSLGRVRRGDLIKASFPDRKGYLRVKLWSARASKNRLIHRLVAAEFIGAIPDGMVCCHRNGDRTCNHAENLRYDTPSGNEADKVLHGTAAVGEAHPAAKLTREQIVEIRSRHKLRCPLNGGRALGIDSVCRTHLSLPFLRARFGSASLNSYFGLLSQASHSEKDRAALARVVLKRGHVVNGALRKTYLKK